jgi:organic hydroperoxide reductase OsmC/OhrA
MADLPMQYETSYRREGAAAHGALSIAGRKDLPVGTPHDIDRYCPEHLLLAAAEICLANYVKLIAEKSKLEIRDYRSTAVGELEFVPKEGYRFKHILIRPVLAVADGSEALAERVVEKSHRACLIARSLTCPVDIDPAIES